MTLFKRAMSDALAKENIKYFFISFALTLAVFGALYFGGFLALTTSIEAYGIEAGWLRWLIYFGVNIVFGTLLYFLMVPSIFLILTLFSETISENIRRQHYPDFIIAQKLETSAALREALVILLRYIWMFIIAAPSLLIVGVGYIVYAIIGFILFRRLLLLDALGGHMSLATIRQRASLSGQGEHMSSTLILYIMSLLPIINLFVPYLALCIIAHESFALQTSVSQKQK